MTRIVTATADRFDTIAEPFTAIPAIVYRDDSRWAPQAESAVRDCLERAAAGELTVFAAVAADGTRPVARAMALDAASSLSTAGSVGLFECLPGSEASGVEALRACMRWLRGRGRRRIIAPRVDTLRVGLQVSGFDTPHTIFTPHNPPSYLDAFRNAGFSIEARMHAFEFTKRRAPRFDPRVHQAFIVRPVDRVRAEDEFASIERFQSLVFGGRIGHTRAGSAAGRRIFERLLPLADPDLILLATDPDDRPIGVLVCIPDHWQRREPIDRARLISVGVAPDWRRRGVAMAMGARLARVLIDKGYETLEGSWVMEENLRTRALASVLGARHVRESVLLSVESTGVCVGDVGSPDA